jgi:hypothetical protein
MPVLQEFRNLGDPPAIDFLIGFNSIHTGILSKIRSVRTRGAGIAALSKYIIGPRADDFRWHAHSVGEHRPVVRKPGRRRCRNGEAFRAPI